MRLKNKVAIVTGGASGIGAATCRLYAQEGAAGIVVADINEEAGRSVADDIVQAGGEAISSIWTSAWSRNGSIP